MGLSIYAYQPGYAAGNPNSHKSFWAIPLRMDSPLRSRVIQVGGGSSLLANSFNQGWSHALNLQDAFDAGQSAKAAGLPESANPFRPGLDYLCEHWGAGWHGDVDHRVGFFVMLHDDVAPDGGWIDRLYDDLLESGADLMAAVVPIKDACGVTSTAIDDPADPFQVIRRLTMAEVYTLPELFSAADCGYPEGSLLVNTGCWICRMDMPWLHDVNPDGSLKLRFHIDDKIIFHERAKAWVPVVAPEDWNFSRDFQKLGGRVMCTRRVGLSHWGALPFTNRSGDWGQWDHDQATAHKFDGKSINRASLEPDPLNERLLDEHACPPTGWSQRYPDVRGWLTDWEGHILAELARDKAVLEIGAYCGLSTIWLSNAAWSLTVVDPFDGRGTHVPGDTYQEFRNNIHRHGNWAGVNVIQGLSTEVKDEACYDFAFVDGAHDYASVKQDIEVVLRAVRPGGMVAFHDYGGKRTPDVKRAVDELLDSGGAVMLETAGEMAVIELAGSERSGATKETVAATA